MASVADVRDVIRGALATLTGFGGRIGARLIFIAFATHQFGAAKFGDLGLVAAYVEILAALAAVGLKRTLMGLMSEQEANGEPVEGLLLAMVCSSLILAIILSGLFGLAWPYVIPDAGAMPLVLYLALPSFVVADVLGAATRYKRIIKWDVLARTFVEPWVLLLVKMLLYWTRDLDTGLLVAYSCSIAAAAIFCLYGVFNTYGLSALKKARFSWRMLIDIPVKSFPAGITDMGVFSFRRLDLIILRFFVGAEASGVYYAVQQLATVPQKVYQLFEPMMAPVIAKLHQNANPKKIEVKLVSTVRWVFILQIGITVSLLAFGTNVLGLFGTDFRSGLLIMIIILSAELFDGTFALVETVLIFIRPKLAMTLILITLVIEAIAVSVGAYYLGAEGAAYGFLFAMLSLAMGRYLAAKFELKISILNSSFLKPTLAAALLAVALLAFQYFVPLESGYITALAFIIGLAGYLYSIKRFALSQEDAVMLKRLRRGR